jgi:hypothetical protein
MDTVRQLEPCPWCGPQDNEDLMPIVSEWAEGYCAVLCPICVAQGPTWSTKEQAAEKWDGWVNACLAGIAERHVRCECGRILEATVVPGDNPHLSVPVCEKCLRDAVEQEMTEMGG